MLQLSKYCCTEGLSQYWPLALCLPKYDSKLSWLNLSDSKNRCPGRLSNFGTNSVKASTVHNSYSIVNQIVFRGIYNVIWGIANLAT